MTKFFTVLGKFAIIPIAGLIFAVYSYTQARTSNQELNLKLTATKAQLEATKVSTDNALQEILTLRNQMQALMETVGKTEDRVSKTKLAGTNEAKQIQQELSDMRRQIISSSQEAKRIEKQLLNARNEINKAESPKQNHGVAPLRIKIEPNYEELK